MISAGFLAVIFFAAPGWLVARRWHWPLPWITGSALSMVSWFHLVLFASGLGLALERTALLPIWGLLTAGAAWWQRGHAPAVKLTRWSELVKLARQQWPWVIAALFGLGSITIRIWIDPLSGWDNSFRWLGLSQTVVEQKSLAFYPAVTPGEFELIGWPDAIPPLVSLLNLWFHFCTGDTSEASAIFRGLGEAILLIGAIGALARRFFGVRSIWPSIGLWATSSLALWSLAMGQETGLTALSLVGLFIALPAKEEGPHSSTAVVAAGCMAVVGALSREYGLAYCALGVGLLWGRRRPWREIVLFSGVCGLAVLPWYARTWWLTGNPLYPMGLGALFPIPPGFRAMSEAVAIQNSWSGIAPKWPTVLGIIGASTGFLLLSGFIGFGIKREHPWARIGTGLAVCMSIALWAWSFPKTGGGFVFSLRVLSPALALLAVVAANLIITQPHRLSLWLGCVAMLFAFDASKRSWLIPWTTTASPFAQTAQLWETQREWELSLARVPVWKQWSAAHGDRLTVVDSPTSLWAVRHAGGRATMLFSPVAEAAFQPQLSPMEALDALKGSGVDYLLLSIEDPIVRHMYERSPFFAYLIEHVRPVAIIQNASAYDLSLIDFAP